MEPEDLVKLLSLSSLEVNDLLAGRLSITVSLARSLAATLGGSTEFWVAREAQYLDDLARVAADRWSQSFPINQMADFGWIEPPRDWQERIDACFAFFEVDGVEAYKERYGTELEAARFRTSPAFALEAAPTAAWFRACERRADQIADLANYNARAFEQAMPGIRELTRVKEVERFLPALVARCASAGVAVVVVPAPQGCTASGAARRYRGRPLIQLSARYLSDDHLWFSFFHEAAHVLRHSLDAPFVDVLEEDPGDHLEEEANEFASEWLMGLAQFGPGRISHRDVIRVAKAVGVSPGILVGQLQHSGRLPKSHLNGLKRRYVWNGSSLETARGR